MKKILHLLLVVVLLLGGAWILYDQLKQPEADTAGTPASNFSEYDVVGNKVQLSDYAGKPMVLNFRASWCGPCKMEVLCLRLFVNGQSLCVQQKWTGAVVLSPLIAAMLAGSVTWIF